MVRAEAPVVKRKNKVEAISMTESQFKSEAKHSFRIGRVKWLVKAATVFLGVFIVSKIKNSEARKANFINCFAMC